MTPLQKADLEVGQLRRKLAKVTAERDAARKVAASEERLYNGLQAQVSQEAQERATSLAALVVALERDQWLHPEVRQHQPARQRRQS